MSQKESAVFEADPERIVEILDDIEAKLKALGVNEKGCFRFLYLSLCFPWLLRQFPAASYCA